jgi:hypothetical protein
VGAASPFRAEWFRAGGMRLMQCVISHSPRADIGRREASSDFDGYLAPVVAI